MTKRDIKIIGARENNLKSVSLTIPKHQLTVFTGVSGSGKSSLVFDTIANESQRQLNATMTNYLPMAGRPEADSIENLSAAVVVNQKQLKGNSRSTVGTITDIFSLLRLLYSRIGQPHVGYSNAFSFNQPQGMCLACNGLGKQLGVNMDRMIDKSKSLNEGAMRFPLLNYEWQVFAKAGLLDGDKRLSDYSDAELNIFLYGNRDENNKRGFEGIINAFERRYIKRDISALSDDTREAIDHVTSDEVCSVCNGARLNQEALNCKVNGYNIAQLSAMEANELIHVMTEIGADPANITAKPIIESILDSLQNLITIGLGYLTLDRETMTLSGGESQRIKMIKNLGSNLCDLIYIFDEPSIGLHPRDVQGLNELLLKLRDQGNTVLVVEHDPDMIDIADHVVDMGPHAGERGGQVVYQGTLAGLYQADTLTGRNISNRQPVKSTFRQPKGYAQLARITRHNLQNVTVDIPLGILTVLTGVAGAGKSTLTEVFLERHPQSIVVDQSPIKTSTRSIPATYTGIMDDIRTLFAKANHVNKALFSFNSDGACSVCGGVGLIYIELPFMDPVKSTCETCGGNRYQPDVLQYTLRGKTISDVLDMTVEEALEFFAKTTLSRTLQALDDVGLGYLRLGQPLSSLSGGECQRIKLANELHKTGSIYVLDEPTTGLHMADLNQLLKIFNRLVEMGNTVIIIEHNLDIIKNADWVIDIGPEGGRHGGKVIFEGTPQALLEIEGSFTADYLRAELSH
jgi:excinuclease UvrABC ATPase subunit